MKQTNKKGDSEQLEVMVENISAYKFKVYREFLH